MSTLSKYIGSIAGLDNFLRLIQSIALIASSRTGLPKWIVAFEQLDYVRRPLRMFGWLACWDAIRARDLWVNNSLRTNLYWLKMWFLGGFLFTEMFVLPFSMNLLSGPLGPRLQQEAFKLWAYSLCFSIISHIVVIWQGHQNLAPTKTVGEKTAHVKHSEKNRPTDFKIYKDLIVDCCDLVIPAVTVNWISMDPSLLGLIIMISTVGAGSDIWHDCQT